VIIALYRNRQVLQESKRWRFLAARPFSAGFFVAIITTLIFFRYKEMPATWQLANAIIGGISLAFLFKSLIAASWKRHFVYGVISIFIVNKLIYVINLPLPLIRLYVVFMSLAALFFLLQWARKSSRHEKSGHYTWLLRLGSLIFASIMFMEIWGKTNLPVYLLASLIQSATLVLVFVLFMYMIHGGVEWLFRASPLRRATVMNNDDTDAIIRHVTQFIYIALIVLALIPGVLMTWRVYDSLESATKGIWTLGFTIGSQKISVGLIITSAGILYGSFFISWLFQKVFVDKVLVKRQIQKGIRLAIGRLVHYAVIFAGFLLAILALGFEFTKLTIMLSAHGVGIGFGLQTIVNNFVSGLILLFERPVRVGDSIELNGKWSEIKKIGLRATTVRTFDDADVIIPNADLVSNQVTNWTLSSRRVRLIIPVGVAYGSDVPLVVETLKACARANPMLAEKPEPQVLFLRFGESTLDFELRVWVLDVDNRLKVQSELHQEIDRRFREAKIEIAFPQRDLHLRSVDEAVMLRPPESTR
jgi:small-conductance mechanosensitive channel